MMAKSPLEIKNIVEGWIKITNAQFQDITQQEKTNQPRLEWIFKINNVLAVYMLEGRSDRITLEVPINFALEHQKATSQMDDKKFLQFLISIVEPLTIVDISVRFEQNQKEIKQISLQTYVDTESLEREKFFRRWDQITAFKEIVIKKVQIEFGVKGMSYDSGSPSSNKSFYG